MAKLDPVKVAKIAATVIVLIVAVIIVFRILKWMKGKQVTPGSDEKIKPPNPAKLSHSLNQFALFADTIQEAVSYSTDDEKAIYAVFNEMNVPEDVDQLIISYGVRKYTQPLGFWMIKGNLISTLHNKLDHSEIAKINSILNKKGINYKI